MNLLLTGGTGYIGSHTAVVLIELGFNVILLDNLSNSSSDVINQIEKITSQKVSFVEGDIRDAEFLSSIMKRYRIDAVIHFAGLKIISESLLDPLKYYENNILGTINLLKAMKENSIKKLIFSSSASVYGNPKYLPIDEGHPTNALNPYGNTKLEIEKILQDISNSDASWEIVCLRYFNPVGSHESGIIGERPKGSPNNLMPYIIGVAKGKFSNLSVFGGDYNTTDGTGVRDYIHVMDLAEAHCAALDFLCKYKGWHVFNLGSGKGVSVLEIIETFNRVNNTRISYTISERREGDVPSIYTSANKAFKALNWKTKRSLEEMCKSAWQSSIGN